MQHFNVLNVKHADYKLTVHIKKRNNSFASLHLINKTHYYIDVFLLQHVVKRYI